MKSCNQSILSTMMYTYTIYIFIKSHSSERIPSTDYYWLKAYMFAYAERIYKSWILLLLWFTFFRSHFLPQFTLSLPLFSFLEFMTLLLSLVHAIVRCVLRQWLFTLNEYMNIPENRNDIIIWHDNENQQNKYMNKIVWTIIN